MDKRICPECREANYSSYKEAEYRWCWNCGTKVFIEHRERGEEDV